MLYLITSYIFSKRFLGCFSYPDDVIFICDVRTCFCTTIRTAGVTRDTLKKLFLSVIPYISAVPKNLFTRIHVAYWRLHFVFYSCLLDCYKMKFELGLRTAQLCMAVIVNSLRYSFSGFSLNLQVCLRQAFTIIFSYVKERLKVTYVPCLL